MIKTVTFGKIDGYHNGRKLCKVEVEFGIREYPDQEGYFTAVGHVWNTKCTDWVWGGQCLDELNEYSSLKHNKLFSSIYNIWKQYHLKSVSEIPESVLTEINTILENC